MAPEPPWQASATQEPRATTADPSVAFAALGRGARRSKRARQLAVSRAGRIERFPSARLRNQRLRRLPCRADVSVALPPKRDSGALASNVSSKRAAAVCFLHGQRTGLSADVGWRWVRTDQHESEFETPQVPALTSRPGLRGCWPDVPLRRAAAGGPFVRGLRLRAGVHRWQ